MQFFLAMTPPKTTAQMHKVAIRGGKPVFYDPPVVVEMKAKLAAHLSAHRPAEPLQGPLQLCCKWIWPGTHLPAYKSTKPDTDNLQKALKDAMTKGGFWNDDAQVASEICEKFTGPQPGIFIKIEQLL